MNLIVNLSLKYLILTSGKKSHSVLTHKNYSDNLFSKLIFLKTYSNSLTKHNFYLSLFVEFEEF